MSKRLQYLAAWAFLSFMSWLVVVLLMALLLWDVSVIWSDRSPKLAFVMAFLWAWLCWFEYRKEKK